MNLNCRPKNRARGQVMAQLDASIAQGTSTLDHRLVALLDKARAQGKTRLDAHLVTESARAHSSILR